MLKLNFKFKTRTQKLNEFIVNTIAQEDPTVLKAMLVKNAAYTEGYNKGLSVGMWAMTGFIGGVSSLCIMYYQLGKNEATRKHTEFLKGVNASFQRIIDDMKAKHPTFTSEEKEAIKKATATKKKTTDKAQELKNDSKTEKKEEQENEEV